MAIVINATGDYPTRTSIGKLSSLQSFDQGCRQDFDGDIAIEPRIGSSIHLAHSTRAEWGEDSVLCARLKSHQVELPSGRISEQ